MAYIKQTFANGQVLKAENLNHIEEGLELASQNADNAVKKTELDALKADIVKDVINTLPKYNGEVEEI